MTLRELYSIPYLDDEIADYEEEIRKNRERAEKITASLTGMPRTGGTGDKVSECAAAIAQYTIYLEKAIAEKVALQEEIHKYIDSVSDPVLRRIMYLRFIKQKPWKEVADDMGGYNTEDSVRKRVERYCKKREK